MVKEDEITAREAILKLNNTIERFNRELFGDREKGLTGIIHEHREMKKDVQVLKNLVIGGKAIVWVIGGIGFTGIGIMWGVMNKLSLILEHIQIK